ncbi:LemA family protein [Erysipelothrix urinaevulpis]|uniref:LemA family protein n=1 Tax=Erysipelothrix urinaevulpis TaxID=2683717 RepID=UPI0013583C4A|nr:LemA family protein [Erysipelothrix urinaevulpis]
MIYSIGVLAVLIVYSISIYNTIKRYTIKVDEALANIDGVLSKRYHVLTQSLEVTKAYVKYEKEVLLDLTRLRGNQDVKLRDEMIENVEQGLVRVNALGESYPELKASSVFLELQKAIVDTEETLLASRRIYNSNVSIYNQRISVFPSSFIASKMKVVERDYLKFDPSEIKNVEIDV